MKVHKLTVVVIDFDELGADGVMKELENARFANDCIDPHVVAVETKDIGGWDDGHPLNKTDTFDAEVKRLFSPD